MTTFAVFAEDKTMSKSCKRTIYYTNYHTDRMGTAYLYVSTHLTIGPNRPISDLRFTLTEGCLQLKKSFFCTNINFWGNVRLVDLVAS